MLSYLQLIRKNIIIQLQDNSDYQLDFENQIFNQDNWYGALYYKIISPKKKYNKYYTILAWDGNSKKSVKKIIDILEIKENEVYFGKNIFLKNNQKSNRVEIEYNSNTSVSVNYDESKNRIIFDHLVPLKENQEGFKAFYVPDGSYDCYQYKNGKWIFKEDIDVRSKITSSKKSNLKEEKGPLENKMLQLKFSNKIEVGCDEFGRGCLLVLLCLTVLLRLKILKTKSLMIPNN